MGNTILPSQDTPQWQYNRVGGYAHAAKDSSRLHLWGNKINNLPVGKTVGGKAWV